MQFGVKDMAIIEKKIKLVGSKGSYGTFTY
jgi:hypothetical protein